MIQSEYKATIKQYLEKDPTTTIAVIGHVGIGKTVIPKQVALEAGVPCVIFHMAEEHPDDIGGIPRVVDGKLQYMLDPRWDVVFNNPAGIIVGDEFNRGHDEARHVWFNVIEESKRMIRGKKIPDGWLNVLTMNPDNGVYQVNDIGLASSDRICPIKLEADQDAWIMWAKAAKLPDSILQFALAHWEFISCDPTKVKRGEGFPTPRSWETVGRWINKEIFNPNNPNFALEEMLIGKVGAHAARQFLSFCRDKYVRFVTAKEIFDTPCFTEDKELQKRFFEQQEAGKNDRINASIRDIGDYILDYLKEDTTKLSDTLEIQLVAVLSDKRFITMNRASLVKRIIGKPQVSATLNKPEHSKLVAALLAEMRANTAKANK